MLTAIFAFYRCSQAFEHLPCPSPDGEPQHLQLTLLALSLLNTQDVLQLVGTRKLTMSLRCNPCSPCLLPCACVPAHCAPSRLLTLLASWRARHPLIRATLIRGRLRVICCGAGQRPQQGARSACIAFLLDISCCGLSRAGARSCSGA